MREILVLRPELDAPASQALESLLAASGGVRVQLRALSGEEVFDLVQRLSGAGEPTRFARRLERATGGNPFFLAEMLRHLADAELLTLDARGAWQTPFDASTEDYGELPVPASVQEAVRSRAQRLAPATRRVLEAAALAAEPFSPGLLAPACALSELEAVLAIEEAVAARLLREHESGGFAFAHDLVQQSLAAALTSERARLVHRRLALGGEAAGAAPAAIAAHHEASGEPQRAVVHRIAAGDEARRLRALADAIAHWTKALADAPTAAQAVAIHERLCKVAHERTDFSVVREQAEALGRLLEGDGLAAGERVDAAIARALALARGGQGIEALALLDALPGEPVGRQRFAAHRTRAVACYELSRSEQAAECVRSALALPDLTDDDRIELLDFAFFCEFSLGHNDAALAHADTALALARRRGGGGSDMARHHFRRGILLLSAHDMDGAERELLTAVREAERLGIVHIERMALYNLTCVYAPQGRHAQALEAADSGWNLSPPLEASDFRVMYLLARVDAHFALGDLGASWRAAEAAIEEALTIADLRASIGAASCALELLGMLGEVGLGRRLLAAIDIEAARELKAAADEMWVALAQFELRQGNIDAAARALAELEASGDAVVARVGARAVQARAELALVRGDARTALALLPGDDAPGMNGEMRTRGLALRIAAQTQLDELDDATCDAAELMLSAATPDHRIATLELSAALSQAAAGSAASAPRNAAATHAALVGRLAETLREHPPQRAAFLRAWPS
jgi:tetratricopeptide (TPR) repeat protein